jgi:hypothetical protein
MSGTRQRWAQAKWWGWACAVLFVLAGSAPAGEAYFVAVFGSQRPAGLPAHTHSFAAFIRLDGCGQLQFWTISWMPRTLQIDIARLQPECGDNLDLRSTLRWAQADGQRISLWGPYQIRKELFDQALRQFAHLNSGAVCYKAVDLGYPADRVCNCVHALGDVASAYSPARVGIAAWGESASYLITRTFSPWMIQPAQAHDWIIPHLGICGIPIIRRDLQRNPARNPLLRALQGLQLMSLTRNLAN